MTLSFAETVAGAHDGVVAVMGTRDLVRVAGPDAHSFLQGQCSQDLARLSPGITVESLVLSPQGRLDAYVRMIAIDDETYCLDLDAGFGVALLERLQRFKLRVKAELSVESLAYCRLRGPGAAALAADHRREGGVVFDYDWPALTGADIAGESFDALGLSDVGDPDAFELLRIRAGEPVMGAELTERTIAQETDLTVRTVSFTKGCFTGQELVAWIDARGSNVARHLRALVVQPGEHHRVPHVGEPIVIDGREVGTVTSSAYSPLDECSYGLGFVHRSVAVPSAATVLAAGGEDLLRTQILALPARD